MVLSNILIVSQNKVDSGFIRACLASVGFGVEIAENTSEGLKRLIHELPDLLIIDCTDQQDIEFCRQIRRLTDMPIVMLSQKQQDDFENTALDAGADDYFARPVSMPILILKITNILKRTHYSKTLVAGSDNLSV